MTMSIGGADICGYTQDMGTVTIRELSRNPSAVVDEVSTSGRPALVTRHGRAVAALIPVDQDALEDLVLATGPRYLQDMADATAALRAGDTVSGSELLSELDADDAGDTSQ